MQGLELEYHSALAINSDFKIGKKYLFYAKGSTMSVLRLDEQIWAYYFRRNGRNYASQIHFFTMDKKRTIVNINQNTANEVLTKLDEQCPYMVVGFNPELQRLFKNNFSEFLNLRYNPAKSSVVNAEEWIG